MLVGVEIGGTKLQIALGNPDGSIVKTVRGKVNTNKGSKGILDWFKENLKELLQEQTSQGTKIDAIGVGFGGPLNSLTGTILKSVQIAGWGDFNLKAWFESMFHIQTFVFNDSSAAGYGEYILGSGRKTKQFFYTNIGSGVGGSLIIDGRLYDGQGLGAAELGQVRIPDWTSDVRGADNRLEALCSGWAIEQRLQKPGYVPNDSLLMEMCHGDVSILTSPMLGKAVAGKDAFALEEIHRVAKGMSMALADILCLIQPERIAVGGGVSLIGEPLFESIRKHVKEREFISNQDRYTIVQCELGEAIVLQGAILLAAENLGMKEE